MTTPLNDGFFMPAEFSRHEGTILVWPSRPGSWPYDAKGGRRAFADVIRAIARSERVYLAAGSDCIDSARAEFAGDNAVSVFECETDDAWARDIAPTFVVDGKGNRRCVNWRFNAWGGEVDGLYAEWNADDAFAKSFARYHGTEIYDAAPFVLEGGSIHCDGEGTLMVTESCLLSAGRNPDMSREQIEDKLRCYLGVSKVLWLPRGIYNDETNEHVDNVAAFVAPAKVVLAWTDNQDDPQYELSKASLEYLESVTDAKGRRIEVVKLPIPDNPICVTGYDLAGYGFAEGEDMREVGERLAASYVNFYFSNGAVIMPAFGGDNSASDRRAVSILADVCPDREIISIDARDILVGGGNIHCITQQIPL